MWASAVSRTSTQLMQPVGISSRLPVTKAARMAEDSLSVGCSMGPDTSVGLMAAMRKGLPLASCQSQAARSAMVLLSGYQRSRARRLSASLQSFSDHTWPSGASLIMTAAMEDVTTKQLTPPTRLAASSTAIVPSRAGVSSSFSGSSGLAMKKGLAVWNTPWQPATAASKLSGLSKSASNSLSRSAAPGRASRCSVLSLRAMDRTVPCTV
mmetsp:Transcript_7412/g.29598  ORF Transcript_7412/g.29598 Transcript_7412/m.29598 type:complete len:210 (-) Transcript_7412:1923-2552(-)